jgi:hypothetical protein
MVTAEFSVVGESRQGKREHELVDLALQPVRRRGLRYDKRGGTSIPDKLEGFRAPELETDDALGMGS